MFVYTKGVIWHYINWVYYFMYLLWSFFIFFIDFVFNKNFKIEVSTIYHRSVGFFFIHAYAIVSLHSSILLFPCIFIYMLSYIDYWKPHIKTNIWTYSSKIKVPQFLCCDYIYAPSLQPTPFELASWNLNQEVFMWLSESVRMNISKKK